MNIKNILGALTYFDWLILPRVLIDREQHSDGSGHHEFIMPIESDWAGASVQQLLGQYGIPLFGVVYDFSTMMFSVRGSDAEYAWKIMQEHDVPVS